MKKGFTLIELLAVIVILGIVIAIAIPGANMVINNSRKKALAAEAELIRNAAIIRVNEDPNFDFGIINKTNIKEYLETDGSLYDEVSIIKIGGKIHVTLTKNGNTVTTLDPNDPSNNLQILIKTYDVETDVYSDYLTVTFNALDETISIPRIPFDRSGSKPWYLFYKEINSKDDIQDILNNDDDYVLNIGFMAEKIYVKDLDLSKPLALVGFGTEDIAPNPFPAPPSGYNPNPSDPKTINVTFKKSDGNYSGAPLTALFTKTYTVSQSKPYLYILPDFNLDDLSWRLHNNDQQTSTSAISGQLGYGVPEYIDLSNYNLNGIFVMELSSSQSVS